MKRRGPTPLGNNIQRKTTQRCKPDEVDEWLCSRPENKSRMKEREEPGLCTKGVQAFALKREDGPSPPIESSWSNIKKRRILEKEGHGEKEKKEEEPGGGGAGANSSTRVVKKPVCNGGRCNKSGAKTRS